MLGIRCERWCRSVAGRYRLSPPDPLAIDPAWALAGAPARAEPKALEQDVLRRGRPAVRTSSISGAIASATASTLPAPWNACPARPAGSAAQVPARLALDWRRLEGQVASAPPSPCPGGETAHACNGAGAGAVALERWPGRNDPLGRRHRCRALASLSELMATALTATRATASKPLFLWPPFSGESGRSQPPWGRRLPAHRWHFLRAEPCRRRNAPAGPRLQPTQANLRSPTRLEAEGCRHGTVRVIAALQASGWNGVRAVLRRTRSHFGWVPALPLAHWRLGPRCPWPLPLRTRPFSIRRCATAQSAGAAHPLWPHSSLELKLELAVVPAAWGPLPCCCKYYRNGGSGRLGRSQRICIAPGMNETAPNGNGAGILDAPSRAMELLELIIELWRGLLGSITVIANAQQSLKPRWFRQASASAVRQHGAAQQAMRESLAPPSRLLRALALARDGCVRQQTQARQWPAQEAAGATATHGPWRAP